ncbi:MAG: chromosome partitioning protein ParB [Firmicutes bacterium HGW-Firmicutes-15]|nr:MAG: chromosome partitioning protein ParB [Firmicutes bacterium HGW-Firmicutes-15]
MGRKERGLGRGLEALLSTTEFDSAQVMELELELIIPQDDQPRKSFDEESLRELANSIREHGILQPVLVRPIGEFYEIIAGERRWRAAEMAGLQLIPALVKEMEDVEAAEISLVENIQRDDLSAIEEARAYKNMVEQYNYTQEFIAERIGKSRAYVTNTMRLLSLRPEIIEMIDRKQITPGHARALLALSSPQEQLLAANDIIKSKLSVRQTEQKVKEGKANRIQEKGKSADLLELEDRLQRHFGTRAEINGQRRGGKIEIVYYNEEDLDRILELLGL